MEGEIRHLADMADYDKLPKLEAKIAFISMPASALGILTERDADGLPPFDSKAWNGLAWITEEIKEQIAEWNRQIG